MRLLSELKRRNVIRMAGLYLVGAWLLTDSPPDLCRKYAGGDYLCE